MHTVGTSSFNNVNTEEKRTEVFKSKPLCFVDGDSQNTVKSTQKRQEMLLIYVWKERGWVKITPRLFSSRTVTEDVLRKTGLDSRQGARVRLTRLPQSPREKASGKSSAAAVPFLYTLGYYRNARVVMLRED